MFVACLLTASLFTYAQSSEPFTERELGTIAERLVELDECQESLSNKNRQLELQNQMIDHYIQVNEENQNIIRFKEAQFQYSQQDVHNLEKRVRKLKGRNTLTLIGAGAAIIILTLWAN